MTIKDTQEPKAKLDNDDILSELGLDDDKVELDSDGLPAKDEFADKAVLDKEGILDEEIPKELEIPKKQPEKTEKKKEQPVLTEKISTGTIQPYIEKIKKLPWLKISAIGGGIIGVFLAGWFLVSFIFTPEGQKKEDVELISHTEDMPKEIQGSEIEKENINLELEPFIIPIYDPKKQTSFLRVRILLIVKYNTNDEIYKETKSIRSTIYTILSHKESKELLDDEQRSAIAKEIQKLLNNILKKDIILNVDLKNILIV